VGGQQFVVEVAEGGSVQTVAPAAVPAAAPAASAAPANLSPIKAPLAGNIIRIAVGVGERVEAGDVVLILEAMKMETEVRAPAAGVVASISASAGDAVAVGDELLALSDG
jgi:oxaloacetate decarboxylase alpha subunit